MDAEAEELFAAELSGYATASEVVGVLRLSELMRRAAESVSRDVVALGSDGHQLDVQLRELVADTAPNSRLLLHDYLVTASGLPDEADVDAALASLAHLPDPDLLGPRAVAQVLGYPTDAEALGERVDPRGYRALARVPRMQYSLMDKLVARFVTLPSLLKAQTEDLAALEGVGPLWARHVRQGLDRLGPA